MEPKDEDKKPRSLEKIRKNGLFGLRGMYNEKRNRQEDKESSTVDDSPNSKAYDRQNPNSSDSARKSMDSDKVSHKESEEDMLENEGQSAVLIPGGLIQHPMISPVDDTEVIRNPNRTRRSSGPMVPKVSVEKVDSSDSNSTKSQIDNNEKSSKRFPIFKAIKANMKNRSLARIGVKEDISLESVERSDGAKQIGYLDIKIRGSKGFKAYNPYMEIHFEGNVTVLKSKSFSEEYKEDGKSRKELDSPVRKKGNNVPPLGDDVKLEDFDEHWPAGSKLHFPVTDVTTNIEIFFMDKRLRTFALGKVVIPLPNLYGAIKPNYGSVETIDGKPEIKDQINGTYVCNIMSLPSNNPDPAKRVHVNYESLMPLVENPLMPIGQLFLDISVHTEATLLHSYFISRPISKQSFERRSSYELASGQKEGKENEEPEKDFDTRQLIINIFRLKRILREAPLVALLKKYPVVALGFWYYITMRVYFCNLPFYILFALIFNGVLQYRQEQKADLSVYPDLVGENVLKAMHTNAFQKIKKMKAMMKSICDLIGTIATGLEKGSNIWNWSDARITAVTILSAFCLCAVFSFIFHITSFNIVAFLLGLGIFLKSFKKDDEIEDGKEEKSQKNLTTITMNKVKDKSSYPTLGSKKNDVGMVITQDFNTDSYINNEDEDEDIFGWDAWINPKKAKTNLIENIIARIPTHFDNVHRRMTANFMKDISTETKVEVSQKTSPKEKNPESTNLTDKKND